ncbi:MAG: AlkA N-terminal domain-containing protein [Gaiellales bacterium]
MTRSPGAGRRVGPRQPLELRPRPPFRLDLTAWALRRREQNTIDFIDGQTYRRTLRPGGRPLAVAVTQRGGADDPRLEVALGSRRSASEDDVKRLLTRLLGLDVDLSAFHARAARDPVLDTLATRFRGLKPPRFPTPFECLLNAVACQQLSLAAGLTLLSRLAARTAGEDGPAPPFPAPAEILRLTGSDLRSIGFSERKADTILELARAARAGEFGLERLEHLDDRSVRESLLRHPGIGPWSADYVLLRALGRLHVFPSHDVGALNGLRRYLAAAGIEDAPGTLARWAVDAGLVYFHLLLYGLEERGALTA